MPVYFKNVLKYQTIECTCTMHHVADVLLIA